jgi:hypothetical protein
MTETFDLLPPGFSHMGEVMDKIGLYGVGLVQKNLTTGNWAPNSPLTVLLKGSSKPLVGRTGNLNTKLNFRREGTDTVVIGYPSDTLAYARLVHDGGEIRPKTSKYLAIPATKQIATLCLSLTPRQVTAQYKAQGYETWFHAAKGDGAVIMAQSKRGKPFVLFILKRSIRLPARPFMNLDNQAQDLLASQFWSLVWQ